MVKANSRDTKVQLIELNKKDSIFQRLGCEDNPRKVAHELRQTLLGHPAHFLFLYRKRISKHEQLIAERHRYRNLIFFLFLERPGADLILHFLYVLGLRMF